jgi:short-subunit dehydrogenase
MSDSPAQTTWQRQTALVTGASGGIGEALARLLAENHHSLILVARRRDRLQALSEELTKLHRVAVRGIAADLADPAEVDKLLAVLRAQETQIDVLVNNAGVGVYGPFVETDWAAEQRMLHLNTVALTQLTKHFVPLMVARRHGRILNVASTAAFQPGPLMAVYYATKAYVLSFSEALANELAGTGVTVTCLCPGPTATEFQAAAKMEGSKLFRGPFRMDAAAVARAGYRGMQRGKPVVIPGWKNRLLAFAVRLAPRRLVTKIARGMQERVEK